MGVYIEFDSVEESLARIEKSLKSLHKKVDNVMAQVKVNQEDLDALDQSLDQVAEDLAAHIDALDLPEGDLSALQADVEALRNLSAPPATEAPDTDAPHPDQTLPGDLPADEQ